MPMPPPMELLLLEPAARVRPVKISAATGAVPYATARDSWLAASRRERGTRLGTVASLAGVQNRPTTSISSVATKSHQRVPTRGMETNSAARSRSPTTIVRLRSHRSAIAPASGPKTIAGARRSTRTAETARFAAA
jgi:hypothetical protein